MLLLRLIRRPLVINFIRRYEVSYHGSGLFEAEFSAHIQNLRSKWLSNDVAPSSRSDALSHWRSCTVRKHRDEVLEPCELSSLVEALDITDFTFEQLRDSLELLTLWPTAVVLTLKRCPAVPSREDLLILRVKDILKRVTIEHCFRDKTSSSKSNAVKAQKFEILQFGNLWSFIDRSKNLGSVHYRIASKICHKEGGRMIRMFKNASPDNYIDLLGMLSRLFAIPPDTHFFYLNYKFYDLYEEMTLHQKATAITHLSALNLSLYKNNTLFSDLSSKIVQDLPAIIATQGHQQVRSALKYISPLVNSYAKEFEEMNHHLTEAKDERSLVYLTSDLCQFANEISIKKAGTAFLRESEITPRDVIPVTNLLAHKHIPSDIKAELRIRLLKTMKNMLTGEVWRGLKKTLYIDTILSLTVLECLDDELIQSFVNSKFFFASKGIPRTQFAYEPRHTGCQLAVIDCYLQLFNGYKSPEHMSKFRARLSGQTLSERDGEWESLHFMKCRNNFLRIKDALSQRLGGVAYLRECQILPHHSYTQVVLARRKEAFTQVPPRFDDAGRGELRRPTDDEDLDWYALSFSSSGHHFERLGGKYLSPNPYLKCLQGLGYSRVLPIDLEPSSEPFETADKILSSLIL